MIINLLLESIRPAETAALRLLAELMEHEPGPGEYLRRAEEIEQAQDQLDDLAERSRQVAQRCKHLRPRSSPQVPAGF